MTDKPKGPASYFPSIEAKYGRSIPEWLAIIAAAGHDKQKPLVDWLKSEHGLGHGHATALAAHHLNPEKWAS
ncbi:DUF4287 domain-containing protein [Nocardia asteroides]|uniref:DUF4287 domain-containing protein n=1 Tax=Nocardia asteroides TaxID=1824 RepID=UPI001E356A0E|nr:DUF4287 domain-containing protein [Nocardia asteroides]UGT60295.1 DUF4287 domain-containing protein [Nocardia asteroides]